MGNEFTRRRFLTAVSAGAAWIALTNTPGCKPAKSSKRATPSKTTSPAQPVLVEGSPPAPQRDAWSFRTRPDLSPRAVEVAKQSHDTAPGYVFVAPEKRGDAGQGGSMIVDNRGQVVWFRPLQSKARTCDGLQGPELPGRAGAYLGWPVTST